MSSIYILFIALPIIFLVILLFIFQGSLTAITVQQLRYNCPYPVMNQNITNVNISGTLVTYDAVDYANANTASKVTVFSCGQSNIISASTAVFTYNSGFFDAQQAWLGYASASMSAFFDKVQAGVNMAWLTLQAPAIVSGFSFFNYIEIVLFCFVGFGLFMMARGSG